MSKPPRHVRMRSLQPPRRQGGATLIFTALFLTILVTTLGLAIDVGRLYAAQTDLQRTANAAAIDAARAIGGCAGQPADPQAVADAAVTTAVNNEKTNNGGPAIEHEQILGVQQSDGSRFSFAPSDPSVADSAQVNLTRPAPAPLVAFFTRGQALTASATAISRPEAGISVGSSLVSVGGVDGKNGLLSALLGGPVSLDAVSYNGLAAANVTIGQLLQAKAGVGTTSGLLNTDLTLPGALSMLADGLDQTVSAVNSTVAATLRDLAAVANPDRRVRLGDVLSVPSGLGSLIDSLPINVAGLLSGLAQAANQGTPVSLPVGINLGGLATANGTINIIQPPQIAFGRAGVNGDGKPRTVANTAQVAIQLNLTVLGALPSILGGALINLPIYLKVASAQATLDDINCAGPANPDNIAGGGIDANGNYQNTVHVGTGTSIAQIGIGQFDDINAFDPDVPSPSQTINLVNALGLAQVSTTGGLQVDLGTGAGGGDPLEFTGPFPPQEGTEIQTQRGSTPVGAAVASGLNDLAGEIATPGQLKLTILGGGLLGGLLNGLLGGVVNTVANLVTPVLGIVDNALLTPILNLLGIDIGTADVSVQSVVVNQPTLYCDTRSCS